jgi:hypothetical protein
MNRRTALKLLAASPLVVLPKGVMAEITPAPPPQHLSWLGVVLVVGAAVMAGGAVVFILSVEEAAGENGNWGEDRFKDLDVRFDYKAVGSNEWAEVYRWSSPPPDMKLMVMADASQYNQPLASNERLVEFPLSSTGGFFRVEPVL